MLQKFPAQRKLGEDEANEEEKKREEMRRFQIFFQLFSLIGLYKEKSKVKDDY